MHFYERFALILDILSTSSPHLLSLNKGVQCSMKAIQSLLLTSQRYTKGTKDVLTSFM